MQNGTEQTSDTVKAIQKNATKLGLTWEIGPGVVTGDTALPVLFVKMDADEQPIPTTSLLGWIAAGTRVWVLTVPGGGAYVIGMGGNEPHAWPRSESGSESVSFTGVASFTQAVTFDRPFLTPPRVFTNIQSSNAQVQNWVSRAFGPTTTGFTIWVINPTGTVGTWTSRTVDWLAVV